MWNLAPPTGFQGLRDDLPIRVYIRHLPHWRQDGATYFVTFRQADSLPQSKLRELWGIRREWEMRNPPPRSNESWEKLSRITMQRVEDWLDQGMGSCRMRDGRAADIVASALTYFHMTRFELGCYVVMPNHVHVVVRPLDSKENSLERILQSWKRQSATDINRLFKCKGGLWQLESFDRIIRDEEHLWRSIQYIGRNPRNAGLSIEDCRLWINPEWELLGWQFEDDIA